jgi:hypothetical protein
MKVLLTVMKVLLTVMKVLLTVMKVWPFKMMFRHRNEGQSQISDINYYMCLNDHNWAF